MSLREQIADHLPAGKISWWQALRKLGLDFARTEGGAAAIYFVLSLPVWLGGLALGMEVGNWYFRRQELQTAADAVASSVAGRIGSAAPANELTLVANEILIRNNFNFATGTSNVRITPDQSANPNPVFVNDTRVEVTLTRSIRRILTSLFLPGDFVINARSVAQVLRATPGCVLSLDRGGGFSLQVQGTANIQLPGCEALANSRGSGFFAQPGSALNADCARTAGTFWLQGQLNVTCQGGPRELAGFTLDPYADVQEPDWGSLNCRYNNTDYTIRISTDQPPPMLDSLPDGRRYVYFCNGSTFTIAKGTVLGDGAYFFDTNARFVVEDGGFTVRALLSTFYFRKGAFPQISAPNTTLFLTAPRTGPQSGLVFFGARDNPFTGTNQIVSGPGTQLVGAIYFPASEVQFQSSGTLVAGCTQIIARSVILSGSWRARGPCVGAQGTRPIVASRIVRLTE